MENKCFFYRNEGWLKKINLEEILVLEAVNNHVIFKGPDVDISVRVPLETFVEQLQGYRFIQIHRSYAVAVDCIGSIGTDSIILDTEPKVELPLSKKYYNDLLQAVHVFEPYKMGCDEDCDRPLPDDEEEII